MGPEQYLALLAATRRQLDVVEVFQIAGNAPYLEIAGPDDRVAEAAAALKEALPALAGNAQELGSESTDWVGGRYQLALPANRMAGFLAKREPGRYWAFPFQRMAFSQNSPRELFPEVRTPRTLPVSDVQSLRSELALLGQGLDPDRRFV